MIDIAKARQLRIDPAHQFATSLYLLQGFTGVLDSTWGTVVTASTGPS
jgi:hypothetical protein